MFPECAGFEGADVLLGEEFNLDHFQLVAKPLMKRAGKELDPVDVMAACSSKSRTLDSPLPRPRAASPDRGDF